MSSILKALEKVEESQSTRRSGGASGFKKARERRRAWLLPAGVLGGAAVAALVTFAAMGGLSRSGAPVSAQQEAAKTAPVVVSPVMPVTGMPATRPEQPLASAPVAAVVVPDPKAAPASTAKPPAKAAAKPGSVSAAAVGLTRVPARISQQRASAPSDATEVQNSSVPATHIIEPTAQVVSEKPRPEIRVTGIAWQKNSASSVAIVNGRSVMQGGIVDGYKVEEILEDEVRFSGQSGKFEVALGAGQ
jgi:general secretion pathway protein B